MSLSKREIGLLGLLVLTGTIFLVAHFLYQPLNLRQEQLRTENGRLAGELGDMEARIVRAGDQGRADMQSQEDYLEMMAAVPGVPMIPEVIDFLELSARETQVKLLSISYKEGADPKDLAKSETNPSNSLNIQTINFKILVSGTHFNLLSLVLKIENAPRLYILNGIKLTMSKIDGASTAPLVITSSHEAIPIPTSAGQSLLPESQFFNPNLSILELDFNAFYECPSLNSAAQP